MTGNRHYLVLTEDGYTTADGPMPKGEALGEFDSLAPGTSPYSGSRLRVVPDYDPDYDGVICPVHHTQLRRGKCAECGEDLA